MRAPFRFTILLVIALAARGAASARSVTRGAAIPSITEYQTAAASAGIDWGGDGDDETVCHVLLRLEDDSSTLTVGLPPRISIATAESWLQELVAGLGWNDARLYSYQSPGRLRVAARVRRQAALIRPFRRRATLNVAVLEARLRKLTRARVLLCVRTIEAAVIAADPTPTARATLSNTTYLFYPRLPQAPLPLAVTYGLTSRQISALSIALALWLLFPVVVLWAYRAQLMQQAELTDERRRHLYASWQRGVQISGLVGTFLTCVILTYSRVVPRFFSPALSLLFPIWWWNGAISKLIALPEARDEPGRNIYFPRWWSIAGEVGLAALTALFLLAPYLVARPALSRVMTLVPLVVGGGGALVWGASMLLLMFRKRTVNPRSVVPQTSGPIADDPAAVRQLLDKHIDEITAEEVVPSPTLPKNAPGFVVRYALAMHAARQSLTIEQQAALKASDELAMSGPPLKTGSLHSVFASFAPLVAAGVIAWLAPGRVKWPVLLLGMGLTWVITTISSHHSKGELESLYRRMADADLRVAGVLDDPSTLLEALRVLAECHRQRFPIAHADSRSPSPYDQRRRRLAQYLGLD